MPSFIYETHMHTMPSSACSKSRGRDYVPRYIDAGYAGIIITDHFWHGNCGIDRLLPWTEFVHQFCAGYEDALNEGIKRGFPVFFGWEESFEGDDYLVYGLDKQWLLDHPEVTAWDRKRQYQEVHRYGGCVVHAHPFRAASYIRDIHLSPWLADAIEGYNAGNQQHWNILGMRYAQVRGLPITAGSDNHSAEWMNPSNLAGVAFEHPLRSVDDYVRAIREQQPMRPFLPQELPAWTSALEPDLPVIWHDREEKPFRQSTMEALRGELPWRR
ncbi:MAG: PHP domain-containing protein [Christensenellaceae bacterium]|nr:PHP domain-containing protein [Christensenellaceae bacterium]